MAPRDPPLTPRGSMTPASVVAQRRSDELSWMMTRERVPQAMGGTRERVLEAVGQGIHGPYDPRVMGAVDRMLDRLAELDVDEERFVRSRARSRSPRRDHTTTTRPWAPRVVIQTSADGQTHTTILR